MCVWNVKEEDRLCKCCKVFGCPDRPRWHGRSLLATEKPVFARLRDMEVGDEEYYPLEKWPTCRTAASKLRNMYGTNFSVGRVNDKVLVLRVL